MGVGRDRRGRVRLGLAERRGRTAARGADPAALPPVGPRRRVARRRPPGSARRRRLLRGAGYCGRRGRRDCHPGRSDRWTTGRSGRWTTGRRGWGALGADAGAAPAAQLRAVSPRGAAGHRAPRREAAVRRAPTCTDRVRSAAVGQVRRNRGPRTARVGRSCGRELDQDRPARRPRSRAGAPLARCSCSTRSDSPASTLTRGRRSNARTHGMAHSRSPGASRPPASSTAGAWREATSGRSPPSSGSRRCCTPPRSAGRAWKPWCVGFTARGSVSSTKRCCAPARAAMPPTMGSARSSPRRTGRGPRSRRPRRRYSGRTGSGESSAPPARARSRPIASSTAPPRST